MVRVDPGTCMDCGACLGSCHVSALSLLRGVVSVDARCDECNVCVRICPVGAITTAPAANGR